MFLTKIILRTINNLLSLCNKKNKDMETKVLVKQLDSLCSAKASNRDLVIMKIKGISRKPQLEKIIKLFVGEDGFIPFEHGFKPKVVRLTNGDIGYSLSKVTAVGYDYIITSSGKISISALSKEFIKAICITLYEYAFYCRYEA